MSYTPLLSCTPGCVEAQAHVQGCPAFIGPTTEWCPECRTRVEVIEAGDAEDQSGPRVLTWRRTVLACGHEVTGEVHRGAASSGEGTAEVLSHLQTQQRLARTTALTEGGDL